MWMLRMLLTPICWTVGHDWWASQIFYKDSVTKAPENAMCKRCWAVSFQEHPKWKSILTGEVHHGGQ